MDINQFQQEVLRVFGEMSKMPNVRKHTKQSAVIHLVEEVGELAKQVTNEFHRPKKFDKENFGTELADILMFVVLLSELYEVDISKEMRDAIKRVEGKLSRLSEKP